jgi:ATP-dependent helicase/DNAse subunit B
LEALRGTALFDPLTRIDAWRSGVRTPAQWAAEVSALRALVSPPRPAEPFTHEAALAARASAAALDAFEGAFDEAAGLMESGAEVPFAEFWRNVRAVLRLAELRVSDRRRDVVHVIDVYEARLWELPVVFVCGLLEKEFPRYHSEEPVFNDAARARLARAGVPVRTSLDRQREERFLFDIAISRATSMAVLSWPRYNAKGDENLRSFFLDDFARRRGVIQERAQPARRAPRGTLRAAPPAPVRDPELRAWIARKHGVLAVTAIESFLQCPFQFFARHTLGLEPAPCAPEERLDIPLKGQILHAVLADLVRTGQADLAAAFRRFCDRERVPEGYRREAALLELKRNLEMFLAESKLPRDWRTEVERSFELPLGEVTLRGRIDRVDTDPASGRAVVVDYKYSSPQTILDNVRAHEQGRLVQGGLYLAAVERLFGLEPAAMVYCGLKREAACEGWRCGVPELPATVTDCAPDVLRGVIDQALTRAAESAANIRAGEIAAAPSDPDKCRYCDFADICRVETVPARVVTAAEGTE